MMASPGIQSGDDGSTKPGFITRLETLTKVSAMLLAFTYGSGFMVVSLHHAQYGIAEMNLLKARILSAGFIFLLLTALPVIATARVFGYFGLGSGSHIPIRHYPKDRSLQQGTLVVLLYQVALLLACATSFALSDSQPIYEPSRLWWVIPFIGVQVIVPILEGRFFQTHPKKCTALAVIAMPASGIAAFLLFGKSFLAWSSWYYVCAIATYATRAAIQNPASTRRFEIERHLAVPVLLLGGFAVWIYGGVKAEYWGGAPIPIQVYLAPEGTKVLGTETASVWLVDQTDYGFYVLRSREEHRALLLPRNIVRGIEFQTEEQAAQSGKSTSPRSRGR